MGGLFGFFYWLFGLGFSSGFCFLRVNSGGLGLCCLFGEVVLCNLVVLFIWGVFSHRTNLLIIDS